jgi:hypothetical protein
LKQFSTVLALALAFITVGCSSSTKTTPPASTAGQAQGVFSGTSSDGSSFQSIILPNDTFYAIYGTTSGNVFYISGMMTGQGASNNGKYTATVTDFTNSGTTLTGSVAATYVTGTSISGTVSESGNSNVSFSGTVASTSSFNYSNAALLSDISGTWTGTLMDGSTAIVNIDASGTFSGSDSGCSFSGSMTPDSSGKNFFDISLTYGASPCLSPNQTQVGIGVDYLLSDGVTHQLLAGVASGTSFGTVFVANR